MTSPAVDALAERLKHDTYTLCAPEGRMVGTPGHATAEQFVVRRFEEIGLIPYGGDSYALPYQHRGDDFTNFVGVIPGRNRDAAPILIGAHYDSVIAAPCADDNGAAVAICLALAEMAEKAGGFERDLIVAIFDAEEPPYFQTHAMGSIRFGEDELDERGVHFAMIYDLVGHDIPMPLFRDLVFVTGSESHPELPGILESTPLPKKLRMIATLNRYVGDMSDHGVFREKGVPYLFFSCGRWQHYHMPTDTPDRLNYAKMARLALLSSGILAAVDQAPFTPAAWTGDDSLEFETKTFRQATGALYPWLCRWAGVKDLETRHSMDRMVEKLLSLGL